MSLLQVKNITKSYSVRMLFSDISFNVEKNDAIGLVGVNGCGKSTLFHIIEGYEPCDSGTIGFAKDCRVGCLEQTANIDGELTVYEAALSSFEELVSLEEQMRFVQRKLESDSASDQALIEKQARLYEQYKDKGGLTFRNRIRSACLGLGLSEDDLRRSIVSLSGGEIRKVYLAMLLLKETDLLLLDEPTNHLDIEAVEWLENYLLSYTGAFVVISHDRYFLDKVTKKTIEIENGHLLITNGNYSQHIERKTDQRLLTKKHYDNLNREIKRIEGIIEQQKRWNQERNYITIASKMKQIERLKKELVAPEPVPPELRFHFMAVDAAGNEILRTEKIRKSFDGKVLFDGVDILIKKNQKVFLLGGNGTGKSTFLKMIRGEIEPDEGNYVIGANVEIGYYDQNVTCEYPEKTVFDEIYDTFPKLDPKEIRNTLAQFLFRGDDVFKTMGSLSGGELARLQLLKLMMLGRNFLVLDEPTNHLDIASREALENALAEYGGTMLIVSHDRYFINKLADKVFILRNGTIEPVNGDYESYRELLIQKELQNEPELKEAPRNDYLLNKGKRAKAAKAKADLKKTEKQIEALEDTIDRKEELLRDPEIMRDYSRCSVLYDELNEIKDKLNALYETWDELSSAASEEGE